MTTNKPLKKKKCRLKTCKAEFVPRSSLQVVCGPRCAIHLAKQKTKEKADKAVKLEKKVAKKRKADFYLNDRSTQTKLAQKEFNAFIRERDKHLPCISCGRHHKGQYHAGHYRTVGAYPMLRFNELNCHKQCSVCNNHLSGNLTGYREALIKKLGLETVEQLEGLHEAANLSVADIVELKIKYREKKKTL